MISVVLVEGGQKKTCFEQELLAGCDPLVTFLKNLWRVDINMKPCKKNKTKKTRGTTPPVMVTFQFIDDF